MILSTIISLSAIPSMGQSGQTSVTGTIQDSNGTLYINSPYTVTFYDPSTSGKLPLLNGSTFQRSYSGLATNSSGVLSISLPDNNVIASTSGATGTQWTFSICTPAGLYSTIYCIPPVTVTISGASQSITSAITAAAPILPLPALGGVASANRIAYGTGPNTIGSSPNLTYNPSTAGISAANINNILYVDGTKYVNLAAALAACPITGCQVIDNLPETFAADPFAAITAPFDIWFVGGIGAGYWKTTTGLRIGHNGQRLHGAGPNFTSIQATGAFPAATAIISIGAPGPSGVNGSGLSGIAIDCASFTGSIGIHLDGVQELSGVSDVQVVNAMAAGIRISSDQGAGASQNQLALDHIRVACSVSAAATCVPMLIASTAGARVMIRDITAVTVTPTVVTDSIRNDSTVSSIMIEDAHVEESVNGFHNTAAGGQFEVDGLTGSATTTTLVRNDSSAASYQLRNLTLNTSTNSLIDTSRTITTTAPFCTVAGVSSAYNNCPDPAIPWQLSSSLSINPPIGAGAGIKIQLLAGFTPTTPALLLIDNAAHNNFFVNNDGRISFHGNSSTSGINGIFQHNNTVTRTYTFPDFDGIVAASNAAQSWSGSQTGMPLVTPTIGGGSTINLYKTVTDTPGAITVNNLTCTDRAVALAGSGTGAIIGIAAAYALDANIYLSPAQAVAGTLHYRICNSSGGNITLNAAAAFNLMVIQ